MKVLFLDIDGVIVTRESLLKHSENMKEKRANGHSFDDLDAWMKAQHEQFHHVCLLNLAEIVKNCPDLKIVVTSTWRLGRSVQDLKDLFPDIIAERIVDKTKASIHGFRGAEIEEWLDRHPEVEKFVILDDDSDMTEVQKKNHFVQTTMLEGLTRNHVDDAIRILS